VKVKTTPAELAPKMSSFASEMWNINVNLRLQYSIKEQIANFVTYRNLMED